MKVNNKNQLDHIEKTIHSYFKNLDVDEIILGINDADFLQISISGEDKKIANKYLIDKIGLCPENIDKIHINSILDGRISKFHGNSKVFIDIGVLKPYFIPAIISLEKLREQLIPINKPSLKTISALFGLTIDLPISIKIINIIKEKRYIQAELSKKQISLFDSWKKSLLDRLIITGASHNQIKKALNLNKLSKDVIDIESLALFEQVLTCKLGTDARGIIPKIGGILKNSQFTVFNPKKIHIFMGNKPILISN
jgi:hypothetical protein